MAQGAERILQEEQQFWKHRIHQIDRGEENNTATDLLYDIFRQALERKASDIHLEPQRDGLLVRLRCDGELQALQGIDSVLQPQIINRLKVMAELDITEKRLPQDGHLALSWQGKQFDVRVSSLPLFLGEKMVLRILGQRDQLLTLSQLGFSAENLQKVQTLLQIPSGIVLVCGPTGSGKTTTLYSMLAALRDTGRNIVTLEDPVEYEMAGINQVQINEKTGLTFICGLRSILRQDPDIIMVGEIRDLESAEIAIRLAYTGHLVLASLHTNDALGAVSRLVEMGVAPYLLASCLNGVVAQRLVRRQQQEKLQGRLAIQEVLVCDKEVRQLISQYELFLQQQEQVAQRFVSLMQDGKTKAAAGQTTLAEVTAVLGPCL